MENFRYRTVQELTIPYEIEAIDTRIHEVAGLLLEINNVFQARLSQPPRVTVETRIEPVQRSYRRTMRIQMWYFLVLVMSGRWACGRLSSGCSAVDTRKHRNAYDETDSEALRAWMEEYAWQPATYMPWYDRYGALGPFKPAEKYLTSCCKLQRRKRKDRLFRKIASYWDEKREILCRGKDMENGRSIAIRCRIFFKMCPTLSIYALFKLIYFVGFLCPYGVCIAVVDLIQLLILSLFSSVATFCTWVPLLCKRRSESVPTTSKYRIVSRLLEHHGCSKREVATFVLATNVNLLAAIKIQLGQTHPRVSTYDYLVSNPVWGLFEECIPIEIIGKAWWELIGISEGEMPSELSREST